MKVVILITLGIISFFGLIYILNTIYAEIPEDSPQYEFNPLKKCSTKQLKYCLDSFNSNIQNILSKLNKKQAEEEVNVWLNQNFVDVIKNEEQRHVGKDAPPKIKVKYDQNLQQFRAYSNQAINVGDLIIGLNETYCLKDEITMDQFDLSKISAEQLQEDIQSWHKLKISQASNKMTLVLLYHLFHLESSKFRPILQAFPTQISALVANITYYEANIVKGLAFYDALIGYVDFLRRDYKHLDYDLKKKLGVKNVSLFFNGHSLTESDYVYARWLIDQILWQFKVKDKHEYVLFFPLLWFEKFEKYEVVLQDQGFYNRNPYSQDSHSLMYYALSDRTISSGELITDNFARMESGSLLISNGDVPVNSIVDCENIQLFVSQFKLQLSIEGQHLVSYIGEQGVQCLQNNNHTLDRVILIGNIFNMNISAQKKCYQLFAAAKTPEEQVDALENKCQQPEWTKHDPSRTPLQHIKSIINQYEQKILNATEYISLREKNKKNAYNGKRILKFLEERLKVVKGINAKIKVIHLVKKLKDRALKENISQEEFQIQKDIIFKQMKIDEEKDKEEEEKKKKNKKNKQKTSDL